MASSINAITTGTGGVVTTGDNSGVLNLQTGSTTAVTVDASQNVGVGTATVYTNSKLAVTTGMTVVANNETWYHTNVPNNGTDLKTWRIGGVTAGALAFQTVNDAYNSATERMRLNSNGNLALQGGTTTATGVGITFPATQSASTDANCLDDYEEGTWTPSLLFGGAAVGMTYTVRTGTYTKIGNLVTIAVSIDCNAIGSSTGSATITGLPFASPSGNASNSAATFAGWSLPGGSVTAPMAASYGSTLYLNHQPSGSVPTALTKTQFGSTSTYVFFTMQYVAA